MASRRTGVRRASVRKGPIQKGRGSSKFIAPSLQRGYGMAIYRGRALQRGHGLGGLFKGLFRIAVPIIRRSLVPIAKRGLKAAAKSALKAAGKKALKTSAYILKDMAEDNLTLKEAVQNRTAEAFNSNQNTINRGAPKRKPITTKKSLKSKVKRKNTRNIIAPELK